MLVVVGLVAGAVIVVVGVAFFFANGARSGKSGILAKAESACLPHAKGEERGSGLD